MSLESANTKLPLKNNKAVHLPFVLNTNIFKCLEASEARVVGIARKKKITKSAVSLQYKSFMVK